MQSAPKSKKRLTFKDQHALDTLPGRIEELQAEIEMLRKTLADPDLFAKNPQKFDASAKELQKAETDLAAEEEMAGAGAETGSTESS